MSNYIFEALFGSPVMCCVTVAWAVTMYRWLTWQEPTTPCKCKCNEDDNE